MKSLSRRATPVENLPPGTLSCAWRWLTLHRVDEVATLSGTVTCALQAAGFCDRDVFCVRLALEEGVVNAIKHGNAGDSSKPVRVGYALGTGEVFIRIEDQGHGFNPDALPDPLAEENLERTCGRGVFLIRAYMTWVRYNERGNCLTFCKRKTA